MDTYNWYSQLMKPAWAPPSWLFGPVWTVLYAIIAVSFGMVFYRAFTGKIGWIDIVLVLGTLIWALYALWHAAPDLRWVASVNIPYLLWVIFATCLQLAITFLNR